MRLTTITVSYEDAQESEIYHGQLFGRPADINVNGCSFNGRVKTVNLREQADGRLSGYVVFENTEPLLGDTNG